MLAVGCGGPEFVAGTSVEPFEIKLPEAGAVVDASERDSRTTSEADSGSPDVALDTAVVTPRDSGASSVEAAVPIEAAVPGSVTFEATGADQSFTAPATTITIVATGAAGSTCANAGAPGLGGSTQATVQVPAGATLLVFAGSSPPCLSDQSEGGQASFVSLSGGYLVVSGGGGGGSWGGSLPGGAGGGTTGEAAPGGAQGGTQTEGGFGSVSGGSQGAALAGGAGAMPGAGGGGGYYGGGGAGGQWSGAGGSSYVISGATSVSMAQGVHVGNGQVTVSW